MKKKPLGRGLETLLPGASVKKADEKPAGGVTKLDITSIRPNKEQPRKFFNDEALNDLVESIKTRGVIQPIIVTPKDGEYMIIAGERRWRASGLAGLKEIPVIIKEVNSETERLELALIENIQREDLNALETAKAYKELMDMHNYKQEDLAKTIGKSRSTVANTLRILNLPQKAVDALSEGLISEGHARALLGLKDEQKIIEILLKVIKNGFSVRDTENAVAKANKEPKQVSEDEPTADVFLNGLESELETFFQAQIKIKNKRKGGTIEIKYSSDEELDRIIKTIRGEN